MTVGPHDRVHGPNPQPGRLIWNLETPDVHGDFERLKTAGATVVQEPYQPDEDPEGWIATFSIPTTTTSSSSARSPGSPPMDERHTRVSDLLHEAAETHHRVFRISDGPMPTGRPGMPSGWSPCRSCRSCSAARWFAAS